MKLNFAQIFVIGTLVGLSFNSCKDFAELPKHEITLTDPVSAQKIGRSEYEISSRIPQAFEIYLSSKEAVRLSPKPISRIPEGTAERPASVRILVPESNTRYYFELKNDHHNLLVSDRQLPLKGADNFRDLGGLPTVDGRFVKWGLFYRADKLSDLTSSDIAYLDKLDIKTVIDFRTAAEIAEQPDVLPKGATYLQLPIYNEAEDTSNIKGRLFQGQFSVEEANELLVDVNTLFGSSEAIRFRPFIEELKNRERVPLVFHCTSGKDRTGFAAFLLLHTLGVDSSIIFDDYLMSNYYRYNRNKNNLLKANLGQYIRPINPEVLKPLMLVDPKYLSAALTAIKVQYGNIDTFMEKEYGITDSLRTQLRDTYLYTP